MRPQFRLKFSPAQLEEFNKALKYTHVSLTPEEMRTRHRIWAIWRMGTGGLKASVVAEVSNVTERTIWRWIKLYQEKGISGLYTKSYRQNYD